MPAAKPVVVSMALPAEDVANSDDFRSVFKHGLNHWWVHAMGREHFTAFGIRYAGGRLEDGHACRPADYDEDEEKQAAARRFDEARDQRLRAFTDGLINDGFAVVQLYNTETTRPLTEGTIACDDISHCAGLMVHRQTLQESDESDDEDSEEGEAPKARCNKCDVELDDTAWRCELCGSPYNQYCSRCFAAAVKFAERPEGFSDLICGANTVINRHFALDQTSKEALRSSQPDDGYMCVPGDKEFFHWRGTSQSLNPTIDLGRKSAIATLRERLLRLGSAMSARLLAEVLQLPVPFRRWGWATMPHHLGGRQRCVKGGYCYADGTGDTLLSAEAELSEEEKQRCDFWLADGLACFDTSLLSAFHYLAKPTELHCKAHSDKGLLTVVLNPEGLEVFCPTTGEWVRADRDRNGARLGADCAIVMPGLTMQAATDGRVMAALHRIANDGGERVSLVAKIRAPADATLDMQWALRSLRSWRSVASVRVADIISIGNSVNAGVALPPAVADEPHPWAALAIPALFGLLPLECLVVALNFLGVVDLASCARVSRSLHAVSTSDGLWIRRALTAGIDWASVPPCGRNKLHCRLGLRLCTYESNLPITLRLLTPKELEDCLIETDGAGQGGRGVVWPPSGSGKEVTIDMQTPLSSVIEPFVEEIRAEDLREHLESERQYPFRERGFDCFQGRPDVFADGPMFRGQSVDPRFTAWHYQLVSGEVISLTEKRGLID